MNQWGTAGNDVWGSGRLFQEMKPGCVGCGPRAGETPTRKRACEWEWTENVENTVNAEKGKTRWEGTGTPSATEPKFQPYFSLLGGGRWGYRVSLSHAVFQTHFVAKYDFECWFLASPSPILVYRHVHNHVCDAEDSTQGFMHSVDLPSYTEAIFSIFLLRKGLFELSKLALSSFLAPEGLELETLPPLVPKQMGKQAFTTRTSNKS